MVAGAVDLPPGGWRRLSLPQKEEFCREYAAARGWHRVLTPKQLEAYMLPARDLDQPVFFGGAWGGGKSSWLCFGAIEACRTIANNRALLCRKEYATFRTSTLQELEEQIADVPGAHRYGSHEIHFSNGSEIWYYGVGTAKQMEKLGSTQFGFIGIDEAPEIERRTFNALQARLRHAPAAARNELRLWLTGNPYPGWIKEDFVVRRKPGYVFIPARIVDNPHIRPGYEERLRAAFADSPEILGAFIEGDWDAMGASDQAIPQRLLEEAVRRQEAPNWSDVVWGVDCSRQGSDWTVVWERAGLRWRRLDRWQGMRGNDAADRLQTMWHLAEHRPQRINIDVAGLGAAVVDPLARHSAEGNLGLTIVGEVLGGGSAADPVHFFNLNAELAAALAAILRDGRGQIIPDEDDLVLGDLGALRTSWSGPRRRVPGNEELRYILGRSPDDGNALLYTLYAGKPGERSPNDDYVPDWANPGITYDTSREGGMDDEGRPLSPEDAEREAKRDRMVRNFFSGLGVPGGIEQVVGEDPWVDDSDIGYSSPVERYRRSRE